MYTLAMGSEGLGTRALIVFRIGGFGSSDVEVIFESCVGLKEELQSGWNGGRRFERYRARVKLFDVEVVGLQARDWQSRFVATGLQESSKPPLDARRKARSGPLDFQRYRTSHSIARYITRFRRLRFPKPIGPERSAHPEQNYRHFG